MLAVLLSSLLAAAEHPCLADADRLCKGVDPGGGRIYQCLKRHEKELSAACRKKRDSFRAREAEIEKSCQEDVDEFCAGVVPGRGTVLKCLARRSSELSGPCKKTLGPAIERARAVEDAMQNVLQVCSPDIQRFCLEADVGGGATEKCLEAHQPQLMLDCKQAFARWKSL